MRKMARVLLLLVLVLSVGSAAFADEYHNIWYASSLTGGGTGALDAVVSGVSIGPGDSAVVISGATTAYFYRAFTSGTAESSPLVIAPDDVGLGTTRWHLVKITTPEIWAGSAAGLKLREDSGTTGLIVTDTGAVGIKTDTPSGDFTVYGGAGNPATAIVSGNTGYAVLY